MRGRFEVSKRILAFAAIAIAALAVPGAVLAATAVVLSDRKLQRVVDVAVAPVP
jgi:hypothetical protein